MRKHVFFVVLTTALSHSFVFSLDASVLEGAYLFEDTLNSSISGAPDLLAIDPSGTSSFETETVLGQIKRVYRTDGTPSDQAGVSLDTSSLTGRMNYSVEMVVRFVDNITPNGWKSLIHADNLVTDEGFYVDPNDKLNLFSPGAPRPGPTTLPLNTFGHIVLTVGDTETRVYLNGQFETSAPAPVLQMDLANNPDQILQFFRDNSTEVGNVQIASLLIYDSVLEEGEIQDRFNDPFVIPEPVSAAIWVLVSLCLLQRRKNLFAVLA